MAGLSIKDAPLAEGVKEDIKIPISDGSNKPKAINIGQIKNFILGLFGKVATSNDYNDLDNKPNIPEQLTEEDIAGMGFTKNEGTYVKPTDGIPESDLSADVVESLNKAKTALQSHQDLSHLATKEEMRGKVDKVDGKQLSTQDFTTSLKKKLEGLNNYDDAEVRELISKLRGDFDTLLNGDTSTAIDTFNNIVAFWRI